MTDIPPPPTFGLVLAGGLARRMGGGDKARIKIGKSTIIDRVLATLSGQCVDIIINATGDPARFADLAARAGTDVKGKNGAAFCPDLIIMPSLECRLSTRRSA